MTREQTPPPVDYGSMAPRAPEGCFELEALWPAGGDIEVDVGFGRGASLFARAEAAPDARLLGVEIKAKWATKVARRAERLGLDRIRIFCGDAREILGRAQPAASVARVFVHFPDPWWKKRHLKRRVVGEVFLDAVARLLRDGGELFIQTDVPDRADLYRDSVRGHGAFELDGAGGFIDANPYANASNRELRAARDGLPVRRLLARRRPRS